MPTVYSIEPMMHAGQVYMPGDSFEADLNDTAAILAAGRGSLIADNGKIAAKQYAADQKAIADRAAAANK